MNSGGEGETAFQKSHLCIYSIFKPYLHFPCCAPHYKQLVIRHNMYKEHDAVQRIILSELLCVVVSVSPGPWFLICTYSFKQSPPYPGWKWLHSWGDDKHPCFINNRSKSVGALKSLHVSVRNCLWTPPPPPRWEPRALLGRQTETCGLSYTAPGIVNWQALPALSQRQTVLITFSSPSLQHQNY